MAEGSGPPAPVRRGPFSVRRGEWAFALVGVVPAVLGGAYALAVVYAGVLLSLTVLGLPFLVAGLLGARGLGTPHRWLVGRFLGERVEAPAPLPRPGGVLARGRVVLGDPVAWRTLLYLVLRLPLGVLGPVAAALPLGCLWLVGFPLWVRLWEPGDPAAGPLDAAAMALGLVLLLAVPAVPRTLAAAERGLARLLLGPARAERRVRELESARSALLAENDDRLRRLERDLHDGTQSRLVALAITLSLTEDALTAGDAPDPVRLRSLVDRARGQTDDTLTELRRLVRGIHPVSLDGGLGRALPELVMTSPAPVTLRVDVPERPDPAAERAVYYCAAELLTNAAKHSGAGAVALTVERSGDRIRLVVRDDGRGGAVVGTGTGLTGLAERLAAVDGRLRVDSPPGGPTTVTAELPARL
ncbi:sensor histidine kinase [Streptomyces sp. NPDC057682]|uniref:sensor histidine kinase n=1 Tax=Streptomyces sp. NPDC057682 TaxID=3346210 RepID=UPI0036B02065